MTDRLGLLFFLQNTLLDFYRQQRPFGFYALPPEQRVLTSTRALIHEIVELEDELQWKPWKNAQPLDQDAIQMEVADCWFFLLQVTLDLGIDANTLFAMYGQKYRENIRRQQDDPRYQAETEHDDETV